MWVIGEVTLIERRLAMLMRNPRTPCVEPNQSHDYTGVLPVTYGDQRAPEESGYGALGRVSIKKICHARAFAEQQEDWKE